MPEAAPGVSLGPELCHRLFPFLIAIDPGLRIVDVGRAVSKVSPGIAVGTGFLDAFVVSRPRGTVSFEAFRREPRATFFLDALATHIRLRGQMVHLAEPDLLLFLGAPWFTDIAELEKTGISLNDFTVHDPIVDFLYMVRAKTLALDDAKRFSQTIARQRDDLEAANQKLERAAEAKSQFLANTSHELRTPLNGILGMASLLVRTDLEPVQRGYAERVLRSARALLTVVNDVLDFSKMEAGKLTIEHERFDLVQLVHDAAEMFAVSAQAKKIELVCSLDHALSPRVIGDAGRLRQIIGNLIGNGIKFTERGEVALRVTSAPAGGDRLRFEVLDTGIGIDPDRISSLFQPFAQVDGSMARRYGGTGLGLAICKQLVELMGGTIGVDSKPGKGSSFWFEIHLPSAPATSDPARVVPPEDLRALRVLVADDNATSRGLLAEQVSRWGVQVAAVEDSIAALASLREAVAENKPYDVALIDMGMPGMSGLDLALVLAGDPAFDGLSTVLLVGVEEAQSEEARLKRARIARALTKPVRASSLFDCLADLTRGHRSSPSSTPAGPEAPAPRRSERILVVDDNEVNREVAQHMIEALGYQVDVSDDGKRAIEMVTQRRYDVVFMDLQMPNVDGYAATVQIRQAEGPARHTPIVAMTAHAMDADRERALHAGMDDYIAKPIDLGALAALLARWTGGSIRSAAPPDPTSGVVLSASSPAIDPGPLRELARFQKAGAADLVADVVGKYLGRLTSQVDAVRAALELGDASGTSRSAHGLKSSSESVGALRLSALCAKLELLGRGGDLDAARKVFPDFEAEARAVRAELASRQRASK